MNNKNKAEILAPGGSFDSAIYSLQNGADAVYFGLKLFSARKSAKNLSFDECLKLKDFAVKNNKKIYATINTIIKDTELLGLIKILKFLDSIDIDGLIIQDPGLINIVKNNFPKIKLHASTQMAIHSSEGIEFLKQQGFKRVVLSRELSLKEITKLKKQHPDMEFEIFIHGALCYSFSGLCLASGLMLKRSGNRGECGQICRTWFEKQGNKDYVFSLNDLALDNAVMELQEIGIESLKIEGRMKSPEYAANTSAWYKSILNNNPDNTLKNKSRISFSRSNAKGYLNYPENKPEINHDFPEHKGIFIGNVIDKNNRGFFIKPIHKISVRDGILFRSENNNFVKQGIKKINVSGRNILYADNKKVFIESKHNALKGSGVFKISSHDLKLKELNPNSFNNYKQKMDLLFILEDETITFKSTIFNKEIIHSEKIEIQKSDNENWQIHIKKALRKSADSYFNPENIEIINKSLFTNIFIQPGKLKLAKNTFYSMLDSEHKKYLEEKIEVKEITIKPTIINDFKIPERSKLVPKNQNDIPFILSFKNLELENIYKKNNYYFLPLSPILLNENTYIKELHEFLDKNDNTNFVIGLNNFAHINLGKTLREKKNVFFYIDYYLYTANRLSAEFYFDEIDKLLFIYYWIEGDEANFNEIVSKNKSLNNKIVKVNSEFITPIFISRTCLKYETPESCKNCNKNINFEINQNSKKFRVIIKNCISWVFKD